MKLNAKQLDALRSPGDDGRLLADRCTLKALRDRGYAREHQPSGVFRITPAGRRRSRLKADEWGKTTFEGPRDQSLMEDLHV